MTNRRQWQRARIRAWRDLSATVRELEIQPDGGTRPWTVGSHIDVCVVVDGGEQARSYSLVGLPRHSVAQGVYRIAVKRAEPSRGGSRFVWSLDTDDEVLIGEPDPHFELVLDTPQALLVAGGIGVTPLVGMAQMLAQTPMRLRMCYAARTPDELVYRDMLEHALGERLSTFCDSAGERLDLEAEIAALPAQAQLVICGPLGMLNAARDAWRQAGRPPGLLRFETFGNTGLHDTQPFWVELPHHGLRIEVPPERSLLDALDAAGVPTLHDCRRGECGLCTLVVVAVQGTIDHRDVFFSADEKQSNQRLCACVSRVCGGGVVLDSGYRAD